MSVATSDIHGTTGANFTFTISSGTVTSAFLEVATKPDTPLTIDGTGREITVPNLPAGKSWARLDIVWGPGDPDALIDVGSNPSGSVSAANPRHTLDAGNTPGFVELFGTGGQR
jgi:hypothetical protein